MGVESIKAANQVIKPQHGGKRAGAGRKPKPRPAEAAPEPPPVGLSVPSVLSAVESPADPPAHPRRAELAATAAAANAGWAIPEKLKQLAVMDCYRVLADPLASNRAKEAAKRTLVAIERLNLKLNTGAPTTPPDALALREFLARDDDSPAPESEPDPLPPQPGPPAG